MTREEFMQKARLTAHKILESKENGIMNLVQQAWAEGKRSATTSYQEGASDVKRAVDKVLDVDSYDGDELFHIQNQYMAADMIGKMTLGDLFEAEKKIDDWVKEQVGEYKVGHVVRDPLGRACMITKIYTGDTAGVMGGFHVLYGEGDTNQWPLGTKFEPLWTDSGLFDDLIGGIRDADAADKEEREND